MFWLAASLRAAPRHATVSAAAGDGLHGQAPRPGTDAAGRGAEWQRTQLLRGRTHQRCAYLPPFVSSV